MERSYGVNHGLSQERNKQKKNNWSGGKQSKNAMNLHRKKEQNYTLKKKPKHVENGKRCANAGNNPKENRDR